MTSSFIPLNFFHFIIAIRFDVLGVGYRLSVCQLEFITIIVLFHIFTCKSKLPGKSRR